MITIKSEEMKNIEKFQKIKQLNALKAEFHKRELINLVSFSKYRPVHNQSGFDLLTTGKAVYSLYKQFTKTAD